MQAFKLIRALAALLLVLTTPAWAETVTFSGQVSWRERMALPPDARLTVNLVTMTARQHVAGAHAGLGGKAGSPIQFTLNVRSEAIAGDRILGLVAEIRSQGRVIFITDTPLPVSGQSSSDIAILVRFLPPPPHDPPEQVLPPVEVPNPLLDIEWVVTSIGSEPVLANTVVTLTLAADHRAGGNGGCNSYFTEASFGTPPLSFGPVAGTRRACAAPIMTQEARFFSALTATAGYELTGDALKLVDAAGIPLVGLIRASE